jgi:hypothetical protein
MPYEKNLPTVTCRVCGSSSNVVNTYGNVQADINCIRCGDYRIIYNGVQLPLNNKKLQALTSYNIRKTQGSKRPIFDIIFLRSLSTAQHQVQPKLQIIYFFGSPTMSTVEPGIRLIII